MTIATTGYNATVQLDNAAGSLTTLGEVISVTPFGANVGTVEATHLTSTSGFREHIPTLSDMGEGAVTINFDPGSATDSLVRTAITDRLVRTFKVTYPDASTFACECFVTSWEIGEVTPDGKMEASLGVKFTGVATYT